MDEIIEQPLKAAAIPKEEIPRLLAKISALLCVLSGNMVTPPVENPKPNDTEDDLISKDEAARLLGVAPHWLSGRKLPFKIRLGHKTVKFSRKGVFKFREARAIKR